MADTPEARVLTMLNSRLETLTTTPATSIAWPNIEFDPNSRPYIDVAYLPVPQGFQTQDGTKRHAGIYQISIVVERHSGLLPALEIAGQIAAHFPQNLGLYDGEDDHLRVTIDQPPNTLPPLYDGPDVRVPVEISFHAFA